MLPKISKENLQNPFIIFMWEIFSKQTVVLTQAEVNQASGVHGLNNVINITSVA